jgi:glucokinase
MGAIFLGALDIGGSKIAATIANDQGPVARVMQATIKSGAPDVLAQQCLDLLASASSLAQADVKKIKSVGVSSCGPFARQNDAIGLVAPNLCGGLTPDEDLPNDWTYIPLEATLRQQFSEVVIENDCVAALTAERYFGAAQSEPNSIYVTWSTGIGFGLCVDGHILRGKHGNAGHAGHILLSENTDALCGCGNRGDLEALVSGRNLAKQYGRTAEEIFAAATAGDAGALTIVENLAKWFGRGLYNLTTTLDTRCILVGGSVWRHHAKLLAPLVEGEIHSRFPALTAGVTLQSAELDELVADIGALTLVMPASWRADWRRRKPWTQLQSITLN